MASGPHPVTQPAARSQEPSEQEKKKKKRSEEEKKKRSERIALIIKLFTAAAALAVVAIGMYSLWGTWRPAPAAEPFTRVGGRTSVETAVDAARFWLNAPKTVVEVPVSAKPAAMLKAAQCAIRNGAPLLYVAPNWKPLRPDRPTIDYWHASIVHFGMTACPRGDSRTPDITLLDVPAQQPLTHLLPRVPAPGKLAPFVVFAAAYTPGDLPDVAVGLALAAHLASTRDSQVSLVVVQPYLEADYALEKQLQNQTGAVTGGVVLGQTTTVPQDTLALLRQLLRAPDQQGLLSQIEANLGSWGIFFGALLALFVVGGSVAQTTVSLVVRWLEASANRPPNSDVIRTRVIETDVINTKVINTGGGSAVGVPADGPGPTTLKPPLPRAPRRWGSRMADILRRSTPSTPLGAEWRKAFGAEKRLSVTCWLRSGLAVTGTFDNENTPEGATPWRIGEAEVLPASGVAGTALSSVSTRHKYVLVPVEDIVLVGVNETASAAGSADPAAHATQADAPSTGE
jgi:hypothetical protein